MIDKKQSLIIISGPTAVGKSSLSVKLAKRIDASIISADSMQVYKGMDIGSAKISAGEMQGIRHYMIDILEPYEQFNIALFKEKAKEYIREINILDKIPIICGGTGFYIQSVLYDIDFTADSQNSNEIRDELTNLAKQYGNEYVHNLLKEVDIKSSEIIHKNNIKRVIRAIEYYRLTGKRISDHNEEMHNRTSPYNFKYFVITMNRKLLYENIDKRVDLMIKNGLVEEVMALKDRGLNRNNISMQGLGYKEILDYLDNLITLDEAISVIKQGTRHFAKRQLTWFKREKDVTWINKDDFKFNDEEILDFIEGQIKNAGII